MTELIKTSSAAPALQIKQKLALDKLPVPERKFIEAGMLPSIKSLPENEVAAGISILVAGAFTNAGQAVDVDQLKQISAAVIRRVKEEFPSATLEELRLAFDNGVFEKYGPHYGLNAKTFVLFVRKYLTDPERSIAKENYRAMLSARTAPDPDLPGPWDPVYWSAEQIEKWKSIAAEFYTNFLADGVAASFVPQQLYYLLVGLQLITMTSEQIDLWRTRARAKILDDYANSKRRSLAKSLADLARAIESGGDPDVTRMVDDEARRIAVLDYFTRQANAGQKTLF